MLDLIKLIKAFLDRTAADEIEIYNEFSLQHELGLFFRNHVADSFKVQFERNVSFFDLEKRNYVKKEIDIVVYSPDQTVRHAIELKYPKNGQHPEQMFSFCKDICFLEQLASNGFGACFFLVVVDDPLFYGGNESAGIYQYFRGGIPLHGVIQKPTGTKMESVTLAGTYKIHWEKIDEKRRYCILPIPST